VDKDTPSAACCTGDIEISSTVTEFAQSAFLHCTYLKSVVMPTTVTAIGDSAFRGCPALTGINIPTSVVSIGPHVFYGSSGLKIIRIPTSVISIDNGAFGTPGYTPCGYTNVATPYVPASMPASVYDGKQLSCPVVKYIATSGE
jgi:hypothetical protein